ncbi:hypothetical protein C0Q70_12691 [Pomacea canaliculata]|uniref:Ig-like domain-containing protein n=1 Tax=Pomacea canaliculata TaxID=400727 RepID=A0A2T7P284_POMCA|nr:hypothetical protein C0Q70_12691 [Pomacea canaliculata]
MLLLLLCSVSPEPSHQERAYCVALYPPETSRRQYCPSFTSPTDNLSSGRQVLIHIYDTTCTTYEQHKYADLTVKATPDVKVSEYAVETQLVAKSPPEVLVHIHGVWTPVHLYHVCRPVDVMDSSRLKLLVVLCGVCGTQVLSTGHEYFTTNTASPPATVRWEGRDSEKLVKTNVQREDNGTQFTCHVTWAGRVYTSITYTLLVAYVESPSDVVSSETYLPGAGNVSVVSTTDSLSPTSDSLASSSAVIGPIVGSVVAVVEIAVVSILLVIFIRRRRRHSEKEAAQYPRESHEEPGLYAHFTPPADNHGYEDLIVRNTTEDSATTQVSAAIMYENTQRLADQTYDTPCPPCEDHQYTDLKVKTTQLVEEGRKGQHHLH